MRPLKSYPKLQVMFAALSTVMIEGVLPDDSTDFLFYLFAITCGISFSSLFLTIVICVETLLTASKFMVSRTQMLNDGLNSSIESIKMLMQTLDCPSNWKKIIPKLRTFLADIKNDENVNEFKAELHSIGKRNSKKRSDKGKEKETISQLPKDQINETFNDAQTIVRLLHEVRPKINSSYMVNNDKQTFEIFWRDTCSDSSRLAINCFYLGTLFMLFAAMVFLYSQFTYTYDQEIAGLVSIFCILCSVGGGAYVKYDMDQKWKSWEKENVKEKASQISLDRNPVEPMTKVQAEKGKVIPRSRTWLEYFSAVRAVVTSDTTETELSPLRRQA